MFAPKMARPQAKSTASSSFSAAPRQRRPNASIQAKFVIGAANDPLEHEADRAADRVMRMPADSSIVRRRCAECEQEKTETVRPKAPGAAGVVGEAPAAVGEALCGSGRPLDRTSREYFEPRFGRDFSRVRIHADSQAAESARAIGASAYTVRNDIVLGAGHGSLEWPATRRLLAHELAHVVQQADTLGLGAYGLVQRFGHDVESCKQEDLEKFVWPGDAYARTIVQTAVETLALDPLPPHVPPLLKNYFMTETPDLATIKKNYAALKAQFEKDTHFYVCKYDCEGTKERKTMGMTKVSRLFGGSGPIVLCLNNMHGAMRPAELAGRTIVHEFCHRYLNFFGDTYCDGGACADLSPADALKNSDSYAMLAGDLQDAKVLAELKKKASEKKP